jgi:hypothetical protein
MELLLGYYSELPGLQLYPPKLSGQGEPNKEELGVLIIKCARGIGGIENGHRIRHNTYGTHHSMIDSSETL